MALSNQQYETIMRRFSLQQQQNRRELMRRRQEIAEKLPAYTELEERSAEISVSCGLSLLSGKTDSTDALREELHAIAVEKEALLTNAGYPKDYLSSPCKCPDCRDTGFIGNEKCHCFLRQEVAFLFQESGLMHELESFPGFDALREEYYKGESLERFRTAVKQAREFAAHFTETHRNFLYTGNVGTGKSFLSKCIAKDVMEQGHSVLYISAARLFQMMGDASFGRADPMLLTHLFHCDLLIIDDLGTEIRTRTTFSQLFECMNERILNGKSTIISTNLSLGNIQEHYTDRIVSRIIEYYEPYTFSADDIRIRMADLKLPKQTA